MSATNPTNELDLVNLAVAVGTGVAGLIQLKKEKRGSSSYLN
jgi:hypothetical protein